MGWKRSRVPPSVHEEATLTKEELERIKLALEIAELRRPWWQKSAYAINALIGLCSVSILFITGSFQANFLRIENEKFILAQQRKELEASSNQKSDKSIAAKFISADLILTKPLTFSASSKFGLRLDREIARLRNKKRSSSIDKSFEQAQLLFPKAKLSPLTLHPTTLDQILRKSARLSAVKNN
jgi:hypothetical protein